MARALYREWFVEFRFPGHGRFPRVASPLGGIPARLGGDDIAQRMLNLSQNLVKRPKVRVHTIRLVEDGVPSIGAENINGIGRHDFGEREVHSDATAYFSRDAKRPSLRDRDGSTSY